MECVLHVKGMGTDIEVMAEGTENSGWMPRAKEWLQEFEQRCSRFSEESDLTRLNRQPLHTLIKLHPILFQVLQQAYRYSTATGFLYHPFVGARMRELGYDVSFEKMKARRGKELSRFQKVNPRSLIFFPEMEAVMKTEEMDMDLGGIGKGWSADQVAGLMQKEGVSSGVVNIGGDMRAWGEERWIGIASPWQEDEDIVHMTLLSGAIATSNKVYRSWKLGEQTVHHILHGYTGMPAESDVQQATVLARTAAEADVLAKILCMMPAAEGPAWLKRYFPNAACVLVREDGKLVMSASIRHFTKRLEF
ncbi:FAD:protein FMN transferase [Ectobacillus ponti]|uniref:FAD:protein FMN transferase n=1 Tax=Ectobacillus ponti TaxID=2961894 RepID=A0AA41XE90_9BACI|nr:FAD:protein FMN transferase [Ectobacillus ponti]MCP8971303.1 FAD:protein FMN transferase [Ectobacillus ponti]